MEHRVLIFKYHNLPTLCLFRRPFFRGIHCDLFCELNNNVIDNMIFDFQKATNNFQPRTKKNHDQQGHKNKAPQVSTIL